MNIHDEAQHNAQHDTTANEPAQATEEVMSEQKRREALNRIGRYSLYIAPVMLAMFSKRAQAGS